MSEAQTSPGAEAVAEELVRMRARGTFKTGAFDGWPKAPYTLGWRVVWTIATALIVLILLTAGVATFFTPAERGPVWLAGLLGLGGAAWWTWILISELRAGPRLRAKALADPEWAQNELRAHTAARRP